jgi:hypothetical protein
MPAVELGDISAVCKEELLRSRVHSENHRGGGEDESPKHPSFANTGPVFRSESMLKTDEC